jgi:hypothetical protein
MYILSPPSTCSNLSTKIYGVSNADRARVIYHEGLYCAIEVGVRTHGDSSEYLARQISVGPSNSL